MNNVIKNIRESMGLTQTELAEKTNLSRKKLYNIENDKVGLKDEDLNKLSSFLAEKMDLSYVAGLFDRSSSINITRINPYKIHKNQVSPMYISKIQFLSKHKILCDIIKNVFKTGKVCTHDSGKQWVFYAHCESVDAVIDGLLPYIKLKREKLLVMKEFREFLEISRDLYRKESWVDLIRQDSDAKDWWTLKTARFKLYNLTSVPFLSLLAQNQRILAKKVKIEKKPEMWLIAPIINCNEIISRLEQGRKIPISQDVLDKYEYFHQKIKEV